MVAEGEKPKTVVDLNAVTKSYPGNDTPAVEGLSFSLSQGEIMAILGPSGCGKTTTLRLIAGFERPEAGEVSLRGQVVSGKHRMVTPEKRGVAMVFQDYALFPHLTVAKNVAFGLRNMDSEARKRRVEEVLTSTDMERLANRYPHQLSGGQQQRVALGRALAPHPIVVLLDEPFSNLDMYMRTQMRKEVRGILHSEGATAILVAHDQMEALSFADKIAVLNQGRLEQVGSPEEIYHQPATPFVAAFVGLASFVPARLQNKEIVTEIGRFPYSGNNVIPSNSEVVTMVRAIDIVVLPDKTSEATIIYREFRGSRNLYTIRLPSGIIVRSMEPSDLVCPVGTKVKVMPSSIAQVSLFPSGSAGSSAGHLAPLTGENMAP